MRIRSRFVYSLKAGLHPAFPNRKFQINSLTQHPYSSNLYLSFPRNLAIARAREALDI